MIHNFISWIPLFLCNPFFFELPLIQLIALSPRSYLILSGVGVGGLEGDGDVYRPDNLDEFRRFVLENTDGLGVHFMMADGVRI